MSVVNAGLGLLFGAGLLCVVLVAAVLAAVLERIEKGGRPHV